LFFAMLLVLLCASGVRGQTSSVSAPAWWAERGALAGLPAADTATVSAQQLYNFALAALLELHAKLANAGGATGTLSAAAALLGTPQPLAGLHAEYFNNADFSGSPVLLRQETTVGFDGGEGGSPAAPAPGVDARGFSARWAGELVPATGGLRVFEVLPTNGTASLWVNGLPIPSGDRFALSLAANQPVSILLEYTAPASANDAAGLWARWGFGPDPAAGQDNFRLTEDRATTAGWQAVGTRELFGLNTLNYESVESLLAAGHTLLTGGPLVRQADADYYNYWGWFHTWGLSGDVVLAYASDYGPLGWGGLTGTVGPWEIAGTPVGGVLALTSAASLGGGNVNLTYIADTADGWLYFGLFSAADFAGWNAMTAFGESGPLGEFRAYENLALLNGTVGRLRAFALALRARLVELGYRELPPLPAGTDTTVVTVGDLKDWFRFDLDTDADGDGRSFAQELLAGTNPYDWYDGEAPIITVVAGDGQSGPDGWALGAPLVVRVTRPNGAPLVGAPLEVEPTEGSALRVDTSVPAPGSGPAPAPASSSVNLVFHTDADGKLILTAGLTSGAAAGAHAMVFQAGRDPLGPPPGPADLCVAAVACVPGAPPAAPEFAATTSTSSTSSGTISPDAVRYIVIPLSDFGWPADVEARELDDHGGVLGGWSGGDAIYWRPGMAAPEPVPVLDMKRDLSGETGAGWAYRRALELSRQGGGVAKGPWDQFPLEAGLLRSSQSYVWPWSALPEFTVRRLSSDGRVAGWLPAGTGTRSDGQPLMLGTRPAVWQHGAATVSYSPGQASAGLSWTDEWNMSMGLVTGGAVAVNKHGKIAGWETRSARDLTYNTWPADVLYPPPNPEGATYPGMAWAGGGSYHQTAVAWLRTAGAEAAEALPGTFSYSISESGSGNDAGSDYTSTRIGPGGTVFLPQFLGDTGLLAGLAATVTVSPASATSTWGDSFGEGYEMGNSYAEFIASPTLTYRPAVWTGTESVSRTISMTGFIAGTATLSGVTHGEGGAEARVFGTAMAAGAGGRVAWYASAGTDWKAKPLKADAGDGRLSLLNPWPWGAFDMNDCGGMVFGTGEAVIDGKLLLLSALVPEGVRILSVLRINALGSILAYAAIDKKQSDGTTITTLTPAVLHRSDATTVTFSGAHHHTLRSDDGTTTYSAPQFKRGTSADRNWPVAYTRSTSVAVGAQFTVPALTGQTVAVRAKFGADVAFTLSGITVGSGGEINVPITTASFALPNAVTLYKAKEAPGEEMRRFQINWEFQPPGATGWSRGESTQHTLYVTWADPKGANNAALPAGTAIYETLINLGVRNADGFGSAKTEQQVVDAIYKEFTDQKVYRVVPGTANLQTDTMKYWANRNGAAVTTDGLLSSGDGQCGAWAKFFTDMLRAQGIGAEFTVILPKVAANATILASARSQFNTSEKTVTSVATALVNDAPSIVMFIKECNLADSWYPLPGVPIVGQGPLPSLPSFVDHAVVRYPVGTQNGHYYDPSYGSPSASSVLAWEANAIKGVGQGVKLTISNSATNQSTEESQNWVYLRVGNGTETVSFSAQNY
jgi:hypothetical protein